MQTGLKKGAESNAKNTVVLTIDDLQRIKDSCTMGSQYEQEMKLLER
jgi:hypothetical protein